MWYVPYYQSIICHLLLFSGSSGGWSLSLLILDKEARYTTYTLSLRTIQSPNNSSELFACLSENNTNERDKPIKAVQLCVISLHGWLMNGFECVFRYMPIPEVVWSLAASRHHHQLSSPRNLTSSGTPQSRRCWQPSTSSMPASFDLSVCFLEREDKGSANICVWGACSSLLELHSTPPNNLWSH